MAEAMLRQRLAARGVAAGVSSAGLLLDHEPAHAHAAEVLTDFGLDLRTHRSRIIDAALVAEADLVIGMEQRHVREVVLLQPDAFDRTFTLPDLVSRAEATGPRGDVPFADWLRELGQDRRRVDVFRQDRRLEVPDPIGGSRRAFRRTADQLADLLDRFVAVAWSGDTPSGHH